MVSPDVAGFVAAQANLRVELGADVLFQIPVAPTWPEGTKINPDTGEPYDATAKPTNDTTSEVTKRCLIILKQASPLRPQPDTIESPAGDMSGMDIIIDIAWDDYADVEDAFEMRINGLDYKIVEAKPFSLNGTPYRYLLYGAER